MALVSWGPADEASDSSPSALSGLLIQCSQRQAPPRHCHPLSKLTFANLNGAPAPQEDRMLGSISQDPPISTMRNDTQNSYCVLGPGRSSYTLIHGTEARLQCGHVCGMERPASPESSFSNLHPC